MKCSLGISDFLEGMMLKLKLQYLGHLMQRVDSLEKTLMLGGIGGRRILSAEHAPVCPDSETILSETSLLVMFTFLLFGPCFRAQL